MIGSESYKELKVLFYSKVEQDQLKKEHTESFVEWIDSRNSYSIIPDCIVFSSILTDGEKMFYVKLNALSDKNTGILMHSNDTLAEEFKCSISNVKKFLDALKKKKAIKTLSVGPNKTRYICLTPWSLL